MDDSKCSPGCSRVQGVYGLIEIGEIADGSQISERGLERILSRYGLRLDARRTGPPDCHPERLVAAIRGACLSGWGSEANVRKSWVGPVPYSGAHVDQETLVPATGRRAGVTEAMRVLAGIRSNLSQTQGAEAVARADGAIAEARPV
jgi:hypothetical protein